MSQTQTIQEIYAAFGRGDVPAILAKLSDTVDWEYGGTPDVPWLNQRKGRDGAGAFFASLAALDIHRFDVKNLFEGDRVVVALIDIDFTVKTTGKRVVEEDEIHIWRFDDQGRVARFRHRADTMLHARAFGLPG